MEKKHARTSMVAAVTSLPGVCFFIFHYESGLVLKIVFENVFFGRLFPHFFSFFIFEHFSQKKWKKNTRTSMVAAVTSSPRVRFFIFHYESGLVLKTVFDKKKLVRISPVFSSFFSHSSSKVISFLFARSEWQHGSYGGLGQRPHRHRQAPPINRRRQVGWWQIERRIR